MTETKKNKNIKLKRLKTRHLVFSIILLMGLFFLSWSIHDTLTLKSERWDLYYPELPQALEGKTIVQLSDLHLESLRITPDKIRKSLTPKTDILVITGDVISTRTDLDKLKDYLGPLEANDGKFIVMGNNDYSHFSHTLFEKYLSMLQDMGWTPLINQAEFLNPLQLWVIGIDDPATAHDDVDKAYSSVVAAEKTSLKAPNPSNPSNASNAFHLVLAHSTDCLNGVAQYGADLLLTGHTHGGQIRFTGFDPLFTNTYLGDKGIYEGYHVIDGVPLYINRGIGESTIPLRLNELPEITLFTLHRGEKNALHEEN